MQIIMLKPLKKLTFLVEQQPVSNAMIAGFFVLLLHSSYLLWKIYILLMPNLHNFVNLSVLWREVWVTTIIVLIFVLMIFGLHASRKKPKSSKILILCMLHLISLSMAYQGYTFGSMSLPSGIMLIGATLVGFLLFERKAVYWVSFNAAAILVATTVAAIFDWLPYAPKLLDSNLPTDRQAAMFLLFNMLLVIIPAYLVITLIANHFISQLKQRTIQLKRFSEQDPLTQLSNRRVIYEYFGQLHAVSGEQWRKHCIIMLDIDFFKKINDLYGHIVGDEVLKYVATVLRANAEPKDIVGRFGGEEFIVILPTDQMQRAVSFAERCQQQLAHYPLNQSQPLSASFGIVSGQQGRGQEAKDLEQLMELADQALYQAKHAGRACMVVI